MGQPLTQNPTWREVGHVLWEGLSPPLENVGALPHLCLETPLGWTIPPGLGMEGSSVGPWALPQADQ